MKLGLTVNAWVDEDLMFAQQLGVNDILAQAVLPTRVGAEWSESLLKALRNRVEKAGLTLAGLHGLPCPLEHATRGDAGANDEIEAVSRFVVQAGEAGIPLISYPWAPEGSGERTPSGRGGGLVVPCATSAPGDAAQWENLNRFLERVLPAAERAGVRLACRTSGALLGLDGMAGLLRLLECAPRPYHGLDLDLGALAATPGVDAVEAIRRLGGRGAILLATLQNYRRLPQATQTCLDEGDTDMLAALRAYREVGYAGVLRPGPQPGMLGDTPWGHKGQAFAVGYLRALLQVVER